MARTKQKVHAPVQWIPRDLYRTGPEAEGIKTYFLKKSLSLKDSLVLLVIAALRLDVDLEEIDMQNISPEFIKANPQHTVPTLVDDGYAIWESRAVARYLANKYDRNNTLYPLDPQQRGTIDSRLDFDLGTLCPSFAQYFQPQLLPNVPQAEAQIKKLKEALSTLNTFLEGRNYAVGSQLTIADLAFVASVSTIEAADVDLKPYPNIIRWFELVKESAPGYKKYNERGLAEFKRMVANIKKARTDMSSTRNQLSQSSANTIGVDNQGLDQANQAGSARPSQHTFTMLYENRSSARPGHDKSLSSERHVPSHQSLNVIHKHPYTQADLQKHFENYKKGMNIQSKNSLFEVKKKNKSRKRNKTTHVNCSCSSHACCTEDDISEDLHISLVNRPNIGPMLVQDESDTIIPASTPTTSRNRFFGCRRSKYRDVKDTGTGGSQAGLFGSSKRKRKLTL